jgi:hypothetical protein
MVVKPERTWRSRELHAEMDSGRFANTPVVASGASQYGSSTASVFVAHPLVDIHLGAYGLCDHRRSARER